MAQAFLITAYKEFDYLVDLATFLSHQGIRVYIHIDKKKCNTEILQRLNVIDSVVAISVYSVPWGGVQHIYAFLALIQLALVDADNVYLHLLTGQDCLCKSSAELNEFFNEENQHNYMEYTDDPCNDFRRRVFFRNDWINFKSKIGRIVTEVLYVLQYGMGINRRCPNHFKAYKGLVYGSLTRSFAEWVLTYLKTFDGKRFLKWTKWNFIPEEFFFQTLIMNSPFADTCVNCHYRYALWEEKHGSLPGVLDESDVENIRAANVFFARKISSANSMKLLHLLCPDM